MAGIEEVSTVFPSADRRAEIQGIVHRPGGRLLAGLVVTHGRSNDMRNPFVKRIAQAAVEAGLLGLRMNFRYVDQKTTASKDLSREEDDVRGAVRFVRSELPVEPIFVAGKSMGARVCARASADPDIAGLVALGYPLHPRFRPQVLNPPEWPMIAKPALFVQGDQDPFCDLARLRDELPKLRVPHALVVIPNAGHSFEPRGGKRDTFPEVREAVIAWVKDALRRADLSRSLPSS